MITYNFEKISEVSWGRRKLPVAPRLIYIPFSNDNDLLVNFSKEDQKRKQCGLRKCFVVFKRRNKPDPLVWKGFKDALTKFTWNLSIVSQWWLAGFVMIWVTLEWEFWTDCCKWQKRTFDSHYTYSCMSPSRYLKKNFPSKFYRLLRSFFC